MDMVKMNRPTMGSIFPLQCLLVRHLSIELVCIWRFCGVGIFSF